MKSLGTVEREAIMKALNSDTQRLLAESTDISEHKQAKLRETLQKCNDHYVKLNKKLRDKVSVCNYSHKFIWSIKLCEHCVSFLLFILSCDVPLHVLGDGSIFALNSVARTCIIYNIEDQKH